MNEHPNRDPFREENGHRARQSASAAIEQELLGDDTGSDVVAIAIYVNGRLVHTKTDSATVAKIMALLTGLGGK